MSSSNLLRRYLDVLNEAPVGAPLTPSPATGMNPAPRPGAAPVPNPGAAPAQDPQANMKLHHQQLMDKMNQKKQIQDQIRQTQLQLADLQKQLTSLT